MAEQKNYAPTAWIREKVFSNGNSILSLQGKTVDFCQWLQSITDERGMFRTNISRRHKPSDKGLTHCLWQDTWKPSARSETPRDDAPKPPPKPVEEPQQGDDLPF